MAKGYGEQKRIAINNSEGSRAKEKVLSTMNNLFWILVIYQLSRPRTPCIPM